MRFETPQAKLSSNVSVIRSFLFTPTRGHVWPCFAVRNMRRTMPATPILATVAGVLPVSQFLSMEPVMEDKKPSVSPNALTVEQLAQVLSGAAQRRVSIEHIQADIEAGAPTNADGTLSVLDYTAWQLQEMHRGQ
ncbi:hypothetical protein Pla22_38230 [Rubripirellula amarantea]|uniref:Uncharacterized protein n=1 Tax=Rubripirellula amarantea TaxID=2527999 RepID=A0A5C5WKC3_9BACT|nr:hypothetical protein [Rubripirellula amarantea]TWT51047.1 hypothetical protein Pla22_38230 [Rubripirellula amarantea]